MLLKIHGRDSIELRQDSRRVSDLSIINYNLRSEVQVANRIRDPN
jgi:hypothetical protein